MLLSSTSSKLMQIFILPQKCRYCSSAATNQMSSLVYSEQCWKCILESFFSNPTLKIVPTSRKHILFFPLKIIFPLSSFFMQLNFWHFIFSVLILKLHTIFNIMNDESEHGKYTGNTLKAAGYVLIFSATKVDLRRTKKSLKSRGVSSQTVRISK